MKGTEDTHTPNTGRNRQAILQIQEIIIIILLLFLIKNVTEKFLF